MIFGTWNPEKILHQHVIDLPISPAVATLHSVIYKVIFQQYYSYVLLIIYVISEQNEL